MREATASAEKPPKTTEWVAPIRAQARIATTASAIIGRYTATRSPLRTPSSSSALAACETSSLSWAYVIERLSPGSPSKWMATRSPRPASTWRSTQLYATLSLPSANHLAKGGLDQSSVSVGSTAQLRRRACSAQKPRRSSDACAYAAAVTFAAAASSAGGAKRRSSLSRLARLSLLNAHSSSSHDLGRSRAWGLSRVSQRTAHQANGALDKRLLRIGVDLWLMVVRRPVRSAVRERRIVRGQVGPCPGPPGGDTGPAFRRPAAGPPRRRRPEPGRPFSPVRPMSRQVGPPPD